MTLEDWLDEWAEAVEAGQSSISRAEAIRRFRQREDEVCAKEQLATKIAKALLEDSDWEIGESSGYGQSYLFNTPSVEVLAEFIQGVIDQEIQP